MKEAKIRVGVFAVLFLIFMILGVYLVTTRINANREVQRAIDSAFYSLSVLYASIIEDVFVQNREHLDIIADGEFIARNARMVRSEWTFPQTWQLRFFELDAQGQNVEQIVDVEYWDKLQWLSEEEVGALLHLSEFAVPIWDHHWRFLTRDQALLFTASNFSRAVFEHPEIWTYRVGALASPRVC